MRRKRGGGRAEGPKGPRAVAVTVGLALLLALALGGCSLRRFAVDRIAAALAAGSAGWGEDDDPELIAAALPFALKTLEGLLAESPRNPELLLATCRGFVAYAGGFVEPEAERLPAADFELAQGIRDRALRLHLRARGYCLRALEVRRPGIAGQLASSPATALAAVSRDSVPLLYWLGAAWGSAVAIAPDRPDLAADLGTVRAIFGRGLELEPDYDRGALEEAMIPLDALPAHFGGSPERARARLDRAVELSGGLRAGPWVAWARSDAVARQDRRAFRVALERALAVDPDASPPDRLANRLAQERARVLLARADELFLAAEEETP